MGDCGECVSNGSDWGEMGAIVRPPTLSDEFVLVVLGARGESSTVSIRRHWTAAVDHAGHAQAKARSLHKLGEMLSRNRQSQPICIGREAAWHGREGMDVPLAFWRPRTARLLPSRPGELSPMWCCEAGRAGVFVLELELGRATRDEASLLAIAAGGARRLSCW